MKVKDAKYNYVIMHICLVKAEFLLSLKPTLITFTIKYIYYCILSCFVGLCNLRNIAIHLFLFCFYVFCTFVCFLQFWRRS